MSKNLNIDPTNKYWVSMRKNGLKEYENINELADNSLEEDVKANYFNVFVYSKEGDNNAVDKIACWDDGIGMDESILSEMIKPGSETSKTEKCLGINGIGFNNAVNALCKKATVYTKTNEGNLLKAETGFDENWKRYGVLFYQDEITDDEIKTFNDNIGHHGTLIYLEEIDRINLTFSQFIKALSFDFQMVYSRLMNEENKIITINGKKIEPISYYSGKDISDNNKPQELSRWTKEFNGISVDYIGYYLPENGRYKIDKDKRGNIIYDNDGQPLKHRVLSNDLYDIQRNGQTAGFYVFRCNRLIGHGLKFGMTSLKGADGHMTSYRGFISVNGAADNILKISANKILRDDSQSDHDFITWLQNNVKNDMSEARKMQREASNLPVTDDVKEKIHDLEDGLKNIAPKVKVGRGTNSKRNTGDTPHTTHNGGGNENGGNGAAPIDDTITKKRNFYKIDAINDPVMPPFYAEYLRDAKKYILHINMANKWGELFFEMPTNAQNMLALIFLGLPISAQEIEEEAIENDEELNDNERRVIQTLQNKVFEWAGKFMTNMVFTPENAYKTAE